MPDYVQLGPVRTWYARRGSGEPLILLHGGATDSRFFDQNIDPLAERFQVLTPDRRGHGHTPDVEGPFTYESMAEDVVAFVEQVVGDSAHLVGHSDGAVVAMVLAIRRPDLVRRLVLISGGYNKDGLVAGGDELDVDQLVQFAGPAYGEVSPDGEDHFRVIAEKIAEMAAREPDYERSELNAIKSRTLVMFSDDDLTSLPHAVSMYDAIADSELAVVPGTSHFLLQEKPELCNAIILDFLTSEPVALVAPMRRAQDAA
jgi:pimeloyl-ACP methyl ester carboxylesterase